MKIYIVADNDNGDEFYFVIDSAWTNRTDANKRAVELSAQNWERAWDVYECPLDSPHLLKH